MWQLAVLLFYNTQKMGNEGRDELINIERLIFTDATVKVP